MQDGHVSQARLEDLKPTRMHWVLLCVAALVATVIWMTVAQWLGRPGTIGRIVVTIVLSFLLVGMIATLMGGMFKVAADWNERNWWGNVWVLWQTRPNHLEGGWVNYKKLPNVVKKGWSLNCPVGGWFNRPFLSHDVGGRSTNFHVSHVRWIEHGGVESVRITDNTSINRREMNPAEILERLEEVYPEGDYNDHYSYGFRHLDMHREERSWRKKRELEDQLKVTQERFEIVLKGEIHLREMDVHQFKLAAAAIDIILQTIWDILDTDRLDKVNSREGRALRGKLTGRYLMLKGMSGADRHDFTKALPKDKKSKRPEHGSGAGSYREDPPGDTVI